MAYFKESLQLQNRKISDLQTFKNFLSKIISHFLKISDDLFLVIYTKISRHPFYFSISSIKNSDDLFLVISSILILLMFAVRMIQRMLVKISFSVIVSVMKILMMLRILLVEMIAGMELCKV